MKRFLLFIIFVFIFQFSHSQTYVPFPHDTAKWHCLNFNDPGPDYINGYDNFNFIMRGDTILKGKSYKKIYIYENNYFIGNSHIYCGGLREDSLKQIFFFPFNINFFIGSTQYNFPTDTSEQLLYTFHNLSVGMTLPINTGAGTIKVVSIDSVLVGTIYHKRYGMSYSTGLGVNDSWIEGIGSNEDMLSPFASAGFDSELFTLCYEDSMTYIINPAFGTDSCHYYENTSGINSGVLPPYYLTIFPNPATESLTIESQQKAFIDILNIEGQSIKTINDAGTSITVDLRSLSSGVYILKATTDKGVVIKKFIIAPR
jgi:hypothetical protein